jgi:signal transduction histidine kinase
MLIRRAATDRVDALPRSLAAAHVSLATFRHFLTIALVALIVAPLALLAMFADTPLQFLPLIVSVGGILWLRLQSISLEKDLRRARVRALDASDLERQRIQRDIHDSAQQRLVSVRIHLGLLAQDAPSAEERTAIEGLGRDLDAALSDIRNVTRQESPELLRQNGVVDSLRSVAAHAPLKVTVETRDFGRYAPQIERGVYYSCLEALQNAVKHGGPKAVVRIRLVGDPHRIAFSVDDSGVGFDPARVQPGVGLVSLADRVDVMGGHLTIDSLPGMGTGIRGEIPIAADQVR